MPLPESISAALETGGIVVASSPRAARALRRLHGEAQRKRGLSAWRAPEILHWEGWLEKLWQQGQRAGSESRLLLSRAQESRIWVRLVTPSIEGQRLISIDGVADLAQEAYARLCAYDALDFLSGEVFANSDVESFREWARTFEHQCREQSWLSRSMLPRALRDSILRGDRGLPEHIVLAGFDRITPAQKSLLDACSQAGCAVQHTGTGRPPVPAEALVAAADSQNEILLCAWWARGSLEEAAIEGRQVRLAVIVPDASSRRSEIERLFRQVLAPGSVSIDAPESPLPFEFSLGVPLARIPMVRSALLLLRWMTDGLRQEELTWLILTGFLWQEESDLLSLAEFDAELRRDGTLPPEQKLESYLLCRGWRRSPARESLRGRLHAARRTWRENRGESIGFAEWVQRAQAILSAAGWPGAYRLTSEDFQVRTKWEQLLDRVAALAFEGRPVRYGEFLRTLEREAELTIFSPESRNAAIQILGPFEAAGMEFDAVWFLGADDANWAAPARPHPFLTQSLQKERGMPHADNNADWELAALVTQRIQRSTARCIFSYATQDKDGQRRPSTVLIPRPPAVSGEEMRERLGLPETAFEDQCEFPALAIEQEPASGILWPLGQSPGGQEVLKRQAACPFQAFAHFRLGAREIDSVEWGLDPMDRGKILHTILQGIWGELIDRNSLIMAKSDDSLRQVVERHVVDALQKHGAVQTGPETTQTQDSQDSWSRAYLEAEKERLVRLVDEWLAYEERRPPFAVECREEDLIAQVGELDLKLRIDRIDQIEGGRLLIDYKSGKVSASAWKGDRPDEPQLPLYAAFGNVAGLRGALFAQVHPGDVQLVGSVDDPSLNPGKSRFPIYTPELWLQWEQVLLALGKQFCAGEAQVDPKNYPKTCGFCALPGLCRVAETQRAWMRSERSEEQDENGEE